MVGQSRAWIATAAIAVAVLSVTADRLAGQSAAATQTDWTPARTPWGDPDLQGQWDSQTSTPLQRPQTLGDKSEISEEEAAAFEAARRRSFDQAPPEGNPGTYNSFWRDYGNPLTQTSLIVDPPDGRIPAFTPEAQAREDAEAAERAKRGPADSYTDFSPWTRCITRGWNGIGSAYSSNYQIFQAPGYVVILHELIHEARVIPLDDRPHLPDHVRQWLGDSRGHWEGDTLVVETTNFDPRADWQGARDGLRLVERYIPEDPNTLRYEFTINDPGTFVQPWTVSMPMQRQTGHVTIFEYACHEGNYAMSHILAGARAQEKAGKSSPR